MMCTSRLKAVSSGRLTGAARRGGKGAMGQKVPGPPTGPAYSLYSTDSEDQVGTIHRGLDRCASLLDCLLQTDSAENTPRQNGVGESRGQGSQGRRRPLDRRKMIGRNPRDAHAALHLPGDFEAAAPSPPVLSSSSSSASPAVMHPSVGPGADAPGASGSAGLPVGANQLSRQWANRTAALFNPRLTTSTPSQCPTGAPTAPLAGAPPLGLTQPLPPSPAPSHPLQPTLAPSHSLPSSPAPSHPLQPTLTPSHPLPSSPAPSHPLQPTLTPSHPLQPTLTPSHPLPSSPAPSHPLQPTLTPSHPLPSSPAPSHPLPGAPRSLPFIPPPGQPPPQTHPDPTPSASPLAPPPGRPLPLQTPPLTSGPRGGGGGGGGAVTGRPTEEECTDQGERTVEMCTAGERTAGERTVEMCTSGECTAGQTAERVQRALEELWTLLAGRGCTSAERLLSEFELALAGGSQGTTQGPLKTKTPPPPLATGLEAELRAVQSQLGRLQAEVSELRTALREVEAENARIRAENTPRQNGVGESRGQGSQGRRRPLDRRKTIGRNPRDAHAALHHPGDFEGPVARCPGTSGRVLLLAQRRLREMESRPALCSVLQGPPLTRRALDHHHHQRGQVHQYLSSLGTGQSGASIPEPRPDVWDDERCVGASIVGGASESVGGGANESVRGGASESMGGGASEYVGGGANESVGGGASEYVGGGANESVGGGASESMGGGASEYVWGGASEYVGGGASESVVGGASESVGGGASESLVGGASESVGGGGGGGQHFQNILRLLRRSSTLTPLAGPSQSHGPPDWEVASHWSVGSGSSFDTRDEVAFCQGLAALDASIAGLKRTLRKDLVT